MFTVDALMNPFSALNARSLNLPDIERLTVDRPEFHFVREAILAKRHNILVHGSRGSGKSFLVMKILGDQKQAKSILPIEIDGTSLSWQSPGGLSSAFGSSVLQALCLELWRKYIGRSASELIAASTEQSGRVF